MSLLYFILYYIHILPIVYLVCYDDMSIVYGYSYYTYIHAYMDMFTSLTQSIFPPIH